MHKLEKIWMAIGIGMLIVFLGVLGFGAFVMGKTPPGGHMDTVDPTKVQQIPPFDHPGLRKIGDNEYEAVIVAYAFGYSPEKPMEVPAGAKVRFVITSQDVVHGFQIPGTDVNLMAEPGEINHIDHTFAKPGEYLILCNEYCGAGHELMQTKLIVK